MNLDKIERLVTQNPFHLIQPTIQVVSDAHVLRLALLFKLPGIGKLGLPIAQVVHL